jgi:hypothetical protein
MEGFGEGKNVWVVSRNGFMNMGGPIFVEEGSYIEGVGGDKAVSRTRIWFNVTGEEEQEGNTNGGA